MNMIEAMTVDLGVLLLALVFILCAVVTVHVLIPRNPRR
jgi:hypothetical protein